MTIQTWTYSGDPRSSALDQVRFYIGDTDPNDKQLGDEEILFLISERDSIYAAASIACLGLVARYAREVTRTVGDLSVQASERQKHYQELHEHFASQVGESGGMTPYVNAAPYVGGISDSDRRAQEADTDRVDPAFEQGKMDFPGTPRGEQSSTSYGYRV